MSDKFNIEQLLTEHLFDEHEQLPTPLFAEIESKILTRKKRRKWLLFLRWFGVGIGVLLAGMYLGSQFSSCQCETYQHVSKYKSEDISAKALLYTKKYKVDDSVQKPINQNPSNGFKEYSQLQEKSSEQNFGTTSNEDPKNNTSIKNNPIKSTNSIKTSQSNSIKPSLTLSNEITSNYPSEAISQSQGPMNNGNESSTLEIESLSIIDSIKHNNSPGSSIKADPKTIILEGEELDTISDLVEEINTQSTEISTVVPLIDSSLVQKKSRMGALIYGGPTVFDIAVFKPYFTSGKLNNQAFESKGFEIGIGAYRKIKNRFSVELFGVYNEKHSYFNYDLMISEADYFNYYQEGELIPIENLDDPNSCNCFLAKDVSLEYKITTLLLSIGGSYDLISKPKYNFGTHMGLATDVSTKFTNKSSSTLNFISTSTERLSAFRIKLGLMFDYKITDQFSLGFSPSYTVLLAQKSKLYSKNVPEVVLPFQVKFSF